MTHTQISDEKAEELFNGMSEYFGDKLANPDQYPMMFKYQMNMYKYHLSKDISTKDDQVIDLTNVR